MPPHRPDESRPPTADEVEEIAAQFLAQLQAGERPDREALAAAHPHVADRLNRRLALVEMMHRVGLAPQEFRTQIAETVDIPTEVSNPNANLPPTVGMEEAEPAARPWPCNPPDYEILCELGHGGMGVVYKTRQKSLNRLVALKMIRAGAYASAELMARFRIEAEALASLQHPNIVQLYEVGTDRGCPYMAMEFLDGGALDKQIAGRPQPPLAAAGLVELLARAMHAAHLRGIIHRDLKPANVLLSFSREPSANAKSTLADSSRLMDCIPKITDFGLAKRLAEGKGQTSPGDIMGTPNYMAPEQAEGRVHEIGPATDIFALGGILYEMLTGRPPFVGEGPADTLKHVLSDEPAALSRPGARVPRDLETICRKCLEKAPPKRYATAEALADDLHRFRNGEPIAARPATPWERVWKWAKRRPAVAALILVIIAASVVLAGSFIWSYGRVRGERDRARANLQVARHAVDDLYMKMATERLFDEPQMDPLCQELLEKAQALYGELAQEHSDDPDVRQDIGRAWFRLAEIHRMRDQHEEAEHAYVEAIVRQEEMCRDYPKEPMYQQDLANSHNWFGELFRDGGRSMTKAEEHFRVALDIQQRLYSNFPDEPGYRMELARSHYNLGIVQKDTNRLAAARTDYSRAVEFLTRLHKEDEKNPNYRQDLARAFINRGVLHRLDGRPLDAGQDYEASIRLLEGLRHEFRARAGYKFELAIAWLNRANLYWGQGQQSEAQRENQKALTSLQELTTDFSSRPRYQKKKGTVLKNLGTALWSSGDLSGAGRCWNQAQSIFETLAKDVPDNADYHGLLGSTLANLGLLRTKKEQWADAQPWFEQSIKELQTALARNDQHPEYRQALRDQYRNLAWTLLQLGDHAAAARAATEMAGVFPGQGQYTYFAACFIARCVPLVQKETGLSEAKRQKLAQGYVEQAVKLLRETIATAPTHLPRIEDEKKVFAHPDFKALLSQLPKGG